jgi:DNA-binding CsgD family transcriptional regulator
VKTVESHRLNIMRKVGVNNVAALTKYAIREGLTTLEG